jgi:hypothetical protein
MTVDEHIAQRTKIIEYLADTEKDCLKNGDYDAALYYARLQVINIQQLIILKKG